MKAAKADILLDEIARREGIEVLRRRGGRRDRALRRAHEASRRKPCARRMEKEGDLGALRARIREEKTLDLLKANARMEFE